MPKRKATSDQPSAEAADAADIPASVITRREEELDQRQHDLERREKELNRERNDLEKDQEEFANEAGRAFGSTSQDDVLTLNVGGTRCDVLRSTLCYAPNSMLASMFSGRWDGNLTRDKDGNFFISQPYRQFLALVDFFRACQCATPDGPPLSIDASCPEWSRNHDFVRMVEYYGCTDVVYPVEIVVGETKVRLEDIEIRQLPERFISVSQRDPSRHSAKLVLKRIGHRRMVKTIELTLGETESFKVRFFDPERRFGLSSTPFIEFCPTEKASIKVRNEDGGSIRRAYLEEINKTARRKPSRLNAVAGDLICVNIDNTGWLEDIRLNGDIIFTSKDLGRFMGDADKFPCYPIINAKTGSLRITKLVLHP